MKKKENQQNNNINNGIAICDSIVMSVKKKRINLRRPEAVIIAVMGYISVIMAFLGMFSFHFDRSIAANAAVVFSGLYIILSLTGKKSGWLVAATALIGGYLIYRELDTIISGYQYVYNVIYKESYHTEINYYKYLKPALEKEATTAFFVAVEWLLALVIYYFTIAHPNPILPLLVTFPIIEVGLYNGIALPVFCGVLVIAYWLALLAMSNIDMGEYSGGTGGFVRKDNLFFPKRQMRLKVTEKCGMLVAFTVILTGIGASAYIKSSDYRRSDELNQKRSDIRDAVTSFSFENITDSLSELTKAFGFTFNYQNHKLGNVDHLKYKNTVDLTVTFDRACDDAVYLKEYTGSYYHDNCWDDLPEEAYSSDLFTSFEKEDMYPQDFPFIFRSSFEQIGYSSYILTSDGQKVGKERSIQINSKLRSDRSFAPYATDKVGLLTYNLDKEVSSKVKTEQDFSYRFYPATAERFVNGRYSEDVIISREDFKEQFDLPDEWFDEAESPLLIFPYINSEDEYTTVAFIPDQEWEDKIFDYAAEHGMLNENGEVQLSVTNFADRYDPQSMFAFLMETEYRQFVYDNYLTIPEGPDIDEIREEFKDVIEIDKSVPGNDKYDIITKLNLIRNKVNDTVSYSLNPGKTPANRDFVNYFLLENKKGYCTHYATAGVLLARMAGIPARYATGYVVVGDDFNSNNVKEDGSYTIDLKDSRSHAWIEIYIDSVGWVPYEFTEGYSSSTIDTNPVTTTATQQESETTTTTTSTTNTTGTKASTTRGTGNTTVSKAETTVQTAVTTVVPSIGSSDDEPVKKIHIPAAVRAVFDFLLLVAAISVTLILRRKIVNGLRERRMTTGSNASRMAYIYGYAEKLLAAYDTKRGKSSYADFADAVEKRFGGTVFPDGEFKEMTDSALEAAFSPTHPDDETLVRFKKNNVSVANYIYRKSSILRQFWLKYIKALL